MKDKKENRYDFRGRKVLVFGLGLLGGGVATTNWLIAQGARVSVTDNKTKEELVASIKKIKGPVKLLLGRYNEADIRNADVVVFNPAVSVNSPAVILAKKIGKQIENEATIFYAQNTNPIVAITGTRGKTTTANWLRHFLGERGVLAGNSYQDPLLKILPKLNRAKGAVVVNEIPSYHLEYFDSKTRPPKIAIMTNLYEDHLNRHKTMEQYATAKANIFANQTGADDLILNADNIWTNFFLRAKPRSKIWFFSTKKIPAGKNGIYISGGRVYLRKDGRKESVFAIGDFKKKWGEHGFYNLLASCLGAHLAGQSWGSIARAIKTLPQVEFRQQEIYKKNGLSVINDTTATSPEGGIAALERFGGSACVFIAGGTDCEFDYKKWARVVSAKILAPKLFLLKGSATEKMVKLLPKEYKDNKIYSNWQECFGDALKKGRQYKRGVLLLSPSAKSFGLFENEYDRGRKFNQFIRNNLK
mgnify:CR=1 FL=1